MSPRNSKIKLHCAPGFRDGIGQRKPKEIPTAVWLRDVLLAGAKAGHPMPAENRADKSDGQITLRFAAEELELIRTFLGPQKLRSFSTWARSVVYALPVISPEAKAPAQKIQRCVEPADYKYFDHVRMINVQAAILKELKRMDAPSDILLKYYNILCQIEQRYREHLNIIDSTVTGYAAENP